ncbi:MAG: rhodanese-like domain-containing protein [Desulfobulbaceae bacterium]|nr:rhodanese-like domain-containing protein [Desulfobulbaceae bacterium]
MKRKALLNTIIFAVIFVPFIAAAGLPIEQVNQNVEKLWKPIKENQPHVTAVEFKKIMDSGEKFILLDVRTEEEYNVAHLPGAVHVSRGLIEWVVPKKITDTDTKIFAYCRTGARSAFVTQRLIEMGYTDVTNIYDAFKGWVEAGYPVYNDHGEFILTADAFEKKDPYVVE